MEKVKISKSQADLLDDLLSRTNMDWVLKHLSDWGSVLNTTKEMVELHHWYISDPLTVSKAMIIGYEVEETPEDKVKNYYHSLKRDEDWEPNEYQRACGVVMTLDLLNIKIEGVNS